MPSRRGVVERRVVRMQAMQAPIDLDGHVRAALRQVWSVGRAPTQILLRRSFVALAAPLRGDLSDAHPPSPASGPPLARLIRPRGVALRTALTAIFVAQCSTGTPAALGDLRVEPTDEQLGWRDLVCVPAEHRPDTVQAATVTDNRIRQVKAALDLLAKPSLGLLSLPRAGTARQRYDQLRLLNEGGVRPAGQAPDYQIPRSNEVVMTMPADFFLNGWLSILDDSEIAAWLMFRHRHQALGGGVDTAGVELSGADRLATYVLKRTIWDQHRILRLMGLMRHDGDDRRRSDGTVDDFLDEGPGSRHRFHMIDTPLGEPAAHSALSSLSAALEGPWGLDGFVL